MQVSPFCKRFKHTHFTGDMFTLPDNREIRSQNTDRLYSVSDRAYHPLPYADMIISGHIARPSVFTLPYADTKSPIHPHTQSPVTLHGLINTKPKTYPINEMVPHLIYYSYATKYHKLSSMFVPGYQCSNIYIDVEKGALMNKDIQ